MSKYPNEKGKAEDIFVLRACVKELQDAVRQLALDLSVLKFELDKDK